MFGEKSIYGKWECKVDDKGRFFLPRQTLAEKGENLILFYDPEEQIFKIYSEKRFNEIVESLQKEIKNTSDLEKQKHLKQVLLQIFKSVLHNKKVDAVGRYIIGVKGDVANQQITVYGGNDHLILEKTQKK